ncbi:MAG: hypothetical protein KDC32_28315, partial [Saprospiraceae bacterium]|nr:hypothetical protein [Saprospiraceae bacterium]
MAFGVVVQSERPAAGPAAGRAGRQPDRRAGPNEDLEPRAHRAGPDLLRASSPRPSDGPVADLLGIPESGSRGAGHRKLVDLPVDRFSRSYFGNLGTGPANGPTHPIMKERLTEKEKMLAGQLYDASDPELVRERKRARDLTYAYNRTTEDHWDERRRIIA